MEKNVKISCSPFVPSIETVGNMVMKLHVPYSADLVTVQFNPSIQEYQDNIDNPNAQVRQLMISTSTSQTRTEQFDFKKNNVKNIDVGGTVYTIKLMNIGKENLQGQDFPFFEFFVTWNDASN